MGINQNNLEEALKTNNETVCGITDDGLYFNNDEPDSKTLNTSTKKTYTETVNAYLALKKNYLKELHKNKKFHFLNIYFD
jgi:hypothetical protein